MLLSECAGLGSSFGIRAGSFSILRSGLDRDLLDMLDLDHHFRCGRVTAHVGVGKQSDVISISLDYILESTVYNVSGNGGDYDQFADPSGEVIRVEWRAIA